MLTVSYDGTAYSGWQLQPNGLTVEEVLNRELSRLLGEEIRVKGVSRTDAGVHALANLCVFDSETRIPPEKLCYAVNRSLPSDIVVQDSREVPVWFHPRKWDSEKTYEYRIDVGRFPNPVRRRYAYTIYVPLDAAAMRQAAACLVGEHDFASFCSAGSQAESTVRNVLSLEILTESGGTGRGLTGSGSGSGGCGSGIIRSGSDIGRTGEFPAHITLRIRGNGFLYNMVRIIAGTLMEVGRGTIPPEAVADILASKDRRKAGPTAPPEGLCLMEIRLIHPPWEGGTGDSV